MSQAVERRPRQTKPDYLNDEAFANLKQTLEDTLAFELENVTPLRFPRASVDQDKATRQMLILLLNGNT